MKENSMEELKQRLEELYKTQQARLACNADDLDIREEIAEVEEEIKELEYDINEENNNGNDTNVGSIENSIEEDILNIEKYVELVIDKNYCDCNELNVICAGNHVDGSKNVAYSMQHLLLDYKRLLKENETYKNQYFGLIDKIENKIDKFDYNFEKAKRKNDNDRADYYWDLIRNFKKLLESEE